MNEENMAPDASEQETEVEETEVETTDDTTEEVDYKSEAEKAKELAENYKRRAEKAERKAKEFKTEDPTGKVELSNMDILAIAKADVHEEDIDRITKFAQLEGISVKDALAHDDMKAILERRAEARRAAAASNTGTGKTAATELDGAGLLEKAKKGQLPDADKLEAMWAAELKK